MMPPLAWGAAGYDIALYEDASAFLAAVYATPNACIVLDMRMPGLTGASLQKELASRGISSPVIVVTADEDPDTRERARQAGAVAFFRKEKPTDAFAAVHCRGHWFWIDDGDWQTKRALTAVMFFFTLAETGGNEKLPLITIPAQ